LSNQAFPGRFGLRSIRERVLNAGGRFEVVAAVGQGTRIMARVPAQLAEGLTAARAVAPGELRYRDDP
jgi:signal transduction histidine kinase